MKAFLNNKNLIIKYSAISVLILLLFILPESLFNDPDRTFCLHRKLLGIQCPLCGMTRACYDMVHLRIVHALKYNAAVAFLPLLLMLDLSGLFFKGQEPARIKKYANMLFIASLLVIYMVRISLHL